MAMRGAGPSAVLAAVLAGFAAGMLIALAVVESPRHARTELDGAYLVSKADMQSEMDKANSMAVRGMSPEYSPGMGMKQHPKVPGRGAPKHHLAGSEPSSSWPNDFYNKPSEFDGMLDSSSVHLQAGPDTSHEWYNKPSKFTSPELDNPLDWYNKPSKFTPPEMDHSVEFYNRPSKFTPPEMDRSFDKYNNMMMPRNCVGGGATSCCPQWASDEGLCPPEEVIPTPGHWY